MKNIKKKLIISGFKIRGFLAEAKNNAKKMLEDETGNIVSYVLMIAIGIIIIGIIIWPALRQLATNVMNSLTKWWNDEIQSKIFGQTIS